MKYRVVIVKTADAELLAIPAFHRRRIAKTVAGILSTEPTRLSKSRIKCLLQPAASVYRLRVGDYRIFYDVEGDRVTVLHVRHKSETQDLYGG